MNELSIIIGADRPDLIREETLIDLFSPSVKKYPHKTALIFHDQSLTYAALDQWSDHIAAYLTGQGIGRNCCVGIWWPRGLHLHAAILGIAKSGAAYVPVDREIPAERVEAILKEVGAIACFSQEKLNTECSLLQIPAQTEEFNTLLLPGPQPDDAAYILYTSGSTGKPKGIRISHKQICHLVRVEQTVIDIHENDKVYQGFSVSFDMWCEETWISYFAGATLWVADHTTSKAIDELSDILNKEKITVLHAVPSLLAVMDNNVPLLRLVNAGGEACTPQVLARWSKPGMNFYNSYGPTETTVTATMARLNRGDRIVIGQPLPNYNLAVIDESLNILPAGEAGELIITGPGLSDGYVKLPQLTHEKFVDKPASLSALPGNRFYRTGDIAVIHTDGNIDIHGRMDDQIKLRGYRIELGEIETKLNHLSGIAAAAAAVKKDSSGQEHLVGYVVTAGVIAVDENECRLALAKSLPAYMVPDTIMRLTEMPRMPSGKINRKALPFPPALHTSLSSQVPETMDLNTPVPDRILAVLHRIFPNRTINPAMDFFTDLGGHSLLAAGFVSQLRRDAGLPKVSLKDVYLYRPLSLLTATWEQQTEDKPKAPRIFNKVPAWRHICCWLAQSVALLLIFGLFAFQVFIPYFGYYYVNHATGSTAYSILTSLALFAVIPFLFAGISILTKWLVIGRFKAGNYPLWGTYYFRWWLVKTMQRLVPAQFLNGTPLYPVYLRIMGMKIAADAQISDFTFGAEDLITVGNDVSISSNTNLNNAIVEDGMLKLSTIVLGDHAYIGSSSVVSGDSVIGEWGELMDLSALQSGKTIKSQEVWQGSAAVFKQKRKIEDLPQPLPVSKFTRFTYKLIFILSITILPLIILVPLLPTIVFIDKLDSLSDGYHLINLTAAPVLALIYILLFAAETILLTRLLQYGIKPGSYPIYSWFYVRKWFADQLISLSLIVLHPIYATVFISWFFRALGAKIGKDTEISTAGSVTHPLLSIGEGAFVADAVTLGEADVRGQQLILSRTTIDSFSFVGNSALIPQGYHLSGNMLIGVLSTPPGESQMESNAAKDWFGSPAIPLPRRQESNPFPPELTIHPRPLRKLARTVVEFIRTILPESAIICFSILFITYGLDLIVNKPLWKIILYFPLYYLLYMGLPAFLLTVILKWVFVGKYKPQQHPMWTWNVWRTEAITSTNEALSVPFLLTYLQGTPWLPLMMRLLGTKTGKRVWMNTTDITEFDMVSIGDDAALNTDCGPQTHLFEDRVMKVGTVKIGARSSIGAGSIILYDSETGDDTKLEALSLVMKGERLSPGTDWAGSPVKPV